MFKKFIPLVCLVSGLLLSSAGSAFGQVDRRNTCLPATNGYNFIATRITSSFGAAEIGVAYGVWKGAQENDRTKIIQCTIGGAQYLTIFGFSSVQERQDFISWYNGELSRMGVRVTVLTRQAAKQIR